MIHITTNEYAVFTEYGSEISETIQCVILKLLTYLHTIIIFFPERNSSFYNQNEYGSEISDPYTRLE